MRARTALAVLALVSAPALAACGGSDEPAASGSGSSGSSSESAEPSEAASEEAGEEAEADAPGPDDFTALLDELEKAQPALRSSQDAQQLNRRADVADTVEFGTFDKQTQEFCVFDTGSGAVLAFTAENALTVKMGQGTCDDYDELTSGSPDPDDPDQIVFEGDQEIGRTVQDFFERIDG